MYIIKDGKDRYYYNWIGNTPVFNGDICSAKVLTESEANGIIKSLKSINKCKYEKIVFDETQVILADAKL